MPRLMACSLVSPLGFVPYIFLLTLLPFHRLLYIQLAEKHKAFLARDYVGVLAIPQDEHG